MQGNDRLGGTARHVKARVFHDREQARKQRQVIVETIAPEAPAPNAAEATWL